MIINACAGQRSNRIIVIAHGIASALRRRENLRITEMADLEPDYQCVFPIVAGSGLDCVHVDLRPSRFWAIERCLHVYAQRILHVRFQIPGVVSDWTYRDYEGVEEFRQQIVSFFTPREERIAEAEKLYSELSSDGKKRILIGVHVRRGDYALWRGGRYCFDDSVYVRSMRSLSGELTANDSRFLVTCIVFSNESLDLNNFKCGECEVRISKGNPLEDHYLMSKCDYLFGPPSTFTRWAAYMGRKPLAYIEDSNQTLSLSDFKYMSI